MNIVNKQQKAGEFLASRDDAKLCGLLDRVGGVAASIGHADNLGFRRLRLQQERREVRRIQGMLDGTEHLAPRFDHDRSGVALQRRTERIVSGQKEPGVAAGLHQCLTGAVGEHVGVVDPMNGVRRALGIGKIRRRRAGIDHDSVLLFHEIVDRKRNAGVQHVHEDVDLLDVDPLARDVGGDVRLVLMVGGNHIDLPALGRKAGILDRHLGRQGGTCAAEVGVKPRIIAQYADLDGLVLRKSAAARGKRQRSAEQESRNCIFHIFSVGPA